MGKDIMFMGNPQQQFEGYEQTHYSRDIDRLITMRNDQIEMLLAAKRQYPDYGPKLYAFKGPTGEFKKDGPGTIVLVKSIEVH
jgi:hypothetical protein